MLFRSRDVLLREGRPINFEDLEKPSLPLKKGEAGAMLPTGPAQGANDQAHSAAQPPVGAFGESHPALPVDDSRLTGALPGATDASGAAAEEAASDGAHGDDFNRHDAAAMLPPAAALVELALLRQRWNELEYRSLTTAWCLR